MTDDDWWLFDNGYGGIHLGYGFNVRSAKAYVLESIAESFAEGGLSPSACRQAAYSYHVRLVGGPMSYDSARAAREAWERQDWEMALREARPAARRAYGLAPVRRTRKRAA